MPPPFGARSERFGDVHRLTFVGELDIASTDAARLSLEDAVAEGPRVLLLDLQHLDFMDCAGLLAIVRGRDAAAAAGVRLAVLNGSGPPHRLLTLAGMDGVLEMVADAAELHPPLSAAEPADPAPPVVVCG